MSKAKLLNIGLIATSLIVYFEWGEDQSNFLFQIEWDLLTKLFKDPVSVLHPFTVLPLMGQIILAISIFQNPPNRRLSLIGMLLIGFLIFFVLFIGFLAWNIKIIGFALPYVIVSFLTIKHHRQRG